MTSEFEGQLHPDLPPKDPGGNGPPDVPPPPRPHPPAPPPVQTPPAPPQGTQSPPSPAPPGHTPPPSPNPLPPVPLPHPPGTGQVITPMLAFQATPCLDALSQVTGSDVRFALINLIQAKLNDLMTQPISKFLPFWQIPVIDSTCVLVDRKHDGHVLQEERGGIWPYPSDDNHWSLQYLTDFLGDNTYTIVLYEFALRKMVESLWEITNKHPKEKLELKEYEFDLVPPNQLVWKVKGTFTPQINGNDLPGVDFTVTYTVTFSIENERLQIKADTHLDTDQTFYGGFLYIVLTGFFPPITSGLALIGQDYLNEKIWEAQNTAVALGSIAGVLAALIPSVVLLEGRDKNGLAHKLLIPWDGVQIEPLSGLTISSVNPLTSLYQPRKPSLALATGGPDHRFPWHPDDPSSNDPQHPGYAQVPLYAEAIDLRTPYTTITWSVPADDADVLLVDPDTSHAIMYVPVPAGPPAPDWTYPVPLTLHIIDADGLDANVTATLTVYYNQNYTPPPPPQQGPPSE